MAELDVFGISELYAPAPGGRMWSADWTSERDLTSAYQADSEDPESVMRGSGSISFGGGVARMSGSPRLYVVDPATPSLKWENF